MLWPETGWGGQTGDNGIEGGRLDAQPSHELLGTCLWGPWTYPRYHRIPQPCTAGPEPLKIGGISDENEPDYQLQYDSSVSTERDPG